MKILTTLPLLALCLAACATEPTLPKGQLVGSEVQPQPSVHFAVVDAAPEPYLGKTVLVEARVKAVCQKMGCWMQVEDEGRTALVRWQEGCGGKYAFPKDAAGKRVLIQGTIRPAQVDDAEIEHMQEESGQKLAIAREGYELTATSVIVLDQP